ncbi:unnamed protein product [Rhizoctonia solani]|uniref:Uncharacterized protein n=1 Tax=Rhizoctonia solani TaxID=456999 RepID=A0A8H3B395_9AGAM|nr:unnamed protein product [Rhizoctonia solani]CAE6492819.1 unnamed protein product [Rhizoctonia solani]
MPDVYSGWTMTILEAEAWRASAHCPDKYKSGKPYTMGDVSALHALLERFLTDLGVKKYVFPEIIHRPAKNSTLSRNSSPQLARLADRVNCGPNVRLIESILRRLANAL